MRLNGNNVKNKEGGIKDHGRAYQHTMKDQVSCEYIKEM